MVPLVGGLIRMYAISLHLQIDTLSQTRLVRVKFELIDVSLTINQPYKPHSSSHPLIAIPPTADVLILIFLVD